MEAHLQLGTDLGLCLPEPLLKLVVPVSDDSPQRRHKLGVDGNDIVEALARPKQRAVRDHVLHSQACT